MTCCVLPIFETDSITKIVRNTFQIKNPNRFYFQPILILTTNDKRRIIRRIMHERIPIGREGNEPFIACVPSKVHLPSLTSSIFLIPRHLH